MTQNNELRINRQIVIPLREIDFSFARSQGPGGQNVNKVNTKATLRWNPGNSQALPPAVYRRFVDAYKNRITVDGELLLHSQRFRDQGRNVADCLAKLQQMVLEVATPPKRRIATRPSKGSVKRRLQNKQAQSERKKRRQQPRLDD